MMDIDEVTDTENNKDGSNKRLCDDEKGFGNRVKRLKK